jgi:Ca2+-binding EF-hand superfamily protein
MTKLNERMVRGRSHLSSVLSQALLEKGIESSLPYRRVEVALNEGSAAVARHDKHYHAKEVEHKKASTETQLVHLLNSKTLEGKVDLRKVVDIRRSIRRRYANRTDFSKIFNAWDLGSLGVLRPEDLHTMVNRLGVQINMDESRVLLATANKSRTGVLSLAEFLELIFDESDKINLDLTSMISDPAAHPSSTLSIPSASLIVQQSTPLAQSQTAQQSTEKFMKNLQELAVNQHTQKVQNTLIFHIKDRLTHVSAALVKGDKKKGGLVGFEAFCEVMNDMSLPYCFSNEKHWRMLYTDMGGTDEGINYSAFITKVKEADIKEDTRLKPLERTEQTPQRSNRTRSSDTSPAMFDKRRMPVSQLEDVMKTLVRLKSKVVRRYPHQAQLTDVLQDLAGGSVISAEKLGSFVKLVEPDIFAKDAGLFLSAFSFNLEGCTEVSDVIKQIYSSEEQGNIELHRIKRVLPPTARQTSDSGKINIRQLLRDVDQKLNWGASRFEAFKRMDLDGDGFLSTDDLITSLKRHNLDVSKAEASALMGEIDAGNQGYLSYQKFAKQMSTPLLHRAKDLWDTREFHLQPSSSYLQSLSSTDLRRTLKSSRGASTVPTRYSAAPQYQDTFENFRIDQRSGMYLSEKDRLEPKSVTPINLNQIDSVRRAQTLSAKQSKISLRIKSYHDMKSDN